jgi:hypothetical protein
MMMLPLAKQPRQPPSDAAAAAGGADADLMEHRHEAAVEWAHFHGK